MSNLLLFFLLITFITSSLGQFQGVALGEAGKIYIFEVLVFVFSLVGFIYLFLSKKEIKISKYLIFFSLFCLLAFLSLLASLNQFSSLQVLTSGFYLVRVIIFLLYSVVVLNVFSTEKKEKLLTYLVFATTLVSFSGFIQLIFFPNLSDLPSEYGWDPHIGRLVSTFFDPNFVGGFVVLGLVILFSRLATGDRKFSNIFFIIVHIPALLLTYSRSSWLAFSILILIFSVLKIRKLFLLFLILVFLTYFFIPRAQTRISGITDPNDSAKLRLISWSNANAVFKDNFVIGTGFNTYRLVQEKHGFFDYKDGFGGHAGSGSDSSVLLVFATTGIIGGIVFLSFYFYVLYKSLTDYIKNKGMLNLIIFSSFAVVFVHSQFVNSFFYPQYLLFLFTVLALKN